MRRTRKWLFVKQEAQRLADLGLSGNAIAHKLGVNQSSVSRWITAGKLQLKGGAGVAGRALPTARRTRRSMAELTERKSPAEWAAAIRAAYQLDESDDQLVSLAEIALEKGLSGDLQAMGRFQTLINQLALVARSAPDAVDDPPKRKQFTAPERSGRDPRALLTAVK